METQQPKWVCIGHIGDVDPIAHGGGFVYTDSTGVYDPEVVWFEPSPDELWHEKQGETPVQVYRFILEKDSTKEWWYDRLADISGYVELPLNVLHESASGDPMRRANLYSDLIHYYGAEEFDSYPDTITEDQAYEKYKAEMALSLSR